MLKRFLITVLLLVGIIGAVAVSWVSAAGLPSLEQQILQAIITLQNSVLAAIAGLQSSVNALGVSNQTNVLATPPFLITDSESSALCAANNVSETTKIVRFQIGGGSIPPIDEVHILPPMGGGSTVAYPAPGAVTCIFTVQNGTRAEVRGSISEIVTSTGDIKRSGPAAE